MPKNVLLLNGLTIEMLDNLSYETNLGVSLKRNLHYFDKNEVMEELKQMMMAIGVFMFIIKNHLSIIK